MPKDWDKNRESLQEYHTIREEYYKKRAQRFLARARILTRDGDPEK